ncbi:hypothetical protein D3C74_128210 [compost metagenome]
MSEPTRTKAETQARRETRTIARHLAHITKDASPLALAELHGKLGRAIAQIAIAEIAKTQKKES